MAEKIYGEFEIVKEINKDKYYGRNIKTKKEVFIQKIKKNFNEKYYNIFLNKTTDEEKKYFATIENLEEKNNIKILIFEKGEGNLEENLNESLIYYNPKQIQYIFNQINIAFKFLYNNDIPFKHIELSDIIFDIEDNKPIFKLTPFFLIGLSNKKNNNKNQLQKIKTLINKLYFNEDLKSFKYTSDEDLNDLIIKLTNNKLNIKNYINHNFFTNDKTKKEINELLLFTEYTNEDIYRLNEEYYLIKYQNKNEINIYKFFPKIIFQYKYDFNISKCKYYLLKDNILLVICFQYYLFLKIDFINKNILLIQKITNYQGICKTILELNTKLVIYIKNDKNIEQNCIIIYKKINYNNIIFQLNLKYYKKSILNISKIDNKSILVLCYEKKEYNDYTNNFSLSIIKINGFKTTKKNFFSIKSDIHYKTFLNNSYTFCCMLNNTFFIILDKIYIIDPNNFDDIYEIPEINDEKNEYSYLHYDKYKNIFIFVGNSLDIIELNKKERKIKKINNLILQAKLTVEYLILIDDSLLLNQKGKITVYK